MPPYSPRCTTSVPAATSARCAASIICWTMPSRKWTRDLRLPFAWRASAMHFLCASVFADISEALPFMTQWLNARRRWKVRCSRSPKASNSAGPIAKVARPGPATILGLRCPRRQGGQAGPGNDPGQQLPHCPSRAPHHDTPTTSLQHPLPEVVAGAEPTHNGFRTGPGVNLQFGPTLRHQHELSKLCSQLHDNLASRPRHAPHASGEDRVVRQRQALEERHLAQEFEALGELLLLVEGGPRRGAGKRVKAAALLLSLVHHEPRRLAGRH
mmetsp:Transcript_116109/g.369425  ORF Transcript_116109/g.369425 Transcript_116109/m.369425 type:complete len:270 (+) Transcript_116109:2731-3540(+)